MVGDTIKEQSFKVNFENLGDSEFITTVEKAEGKDRLHFYIKHANALSELKYESDSGFLYPEVSAVSFRDVNGDGRKDIIAIVNYTTGAGRMGTIPISKLLIFKQNESGFIEDLSLEEKAEAGAPYRIMTVQDVMTGLKTDSKDGVSKAWQRVIPGEYILEGSNELHGSTLTIKKASGTGLSFSLDAFYATNKEAIQRGGVNIGNIDNGEATPQHSEMVFTDTSSGYELSFSLLSNNEIYLQDNGKPYYGHNVSVNGAYSLKKK